MFRVFCLLLLVGLAMQLVLWSHDYDPRFYQFLGTAPGKALSEFMEWPNLYNRVNAEKDIDTYSAEESKWKQKLENQIRQTWPTHTLGLKDGTELHVRLLSQTKTHLHIREYFGGQGRLDRDIDKSTLGNIKVYDEEVPTVTLRDIHFQMEYPEFNITYFGHFTILTDAPYFQVSTSVEALEYLRSQYVELFTSIFRFPQTNQNLQVLFFSNEKDFRRHQNDTAPELDSSVGYYSPLEDRMVVFNQQFSLRADEVRVVVKEDIQELLSLAKTSGQRQQILQMQQHAEEQIRDQAHLETLATLRHEGAHHLSYTYGVHSWMHTENGWLIEGLACYFEQISPGNPDPSYVRSLFRLELEGRIPSVSQLVEVRQPDQFEAELPGIRAHETYALSWSLFHFCMLPENRDNFFAYLAYIQSPSDIGALMKHQRVELLSKYLGLSKFELNQKWREHIRTLLWNMAAT